MNIDAVAVIAAFALIIFFANDSLAMKVRRDGRIDILATAVHSSVNMYPQSAVGPLSVVKEGVYLFNGVRIGRNVTIGKDAYLYNHAIVDDDSRVHNGAVLGHEAKCGTSTFIGQDARIKDNAIVENGARVMKNGRVGWHGIVGEDAVLGEGAQMERFSCLASFALVGPGTVMGPNSVVQMFTVVPGGLNIAEGQVVFSAPDSSIALRLIQRRYFSQRFHNKVDMLVAKSDRSFVREMDAEIGTILGNVNRDCEKAENFGSQVRYLIYAYLQRMHGRNKLIQAMESNKVETVQNGIMREELNDCDNAKRYDVIFPGKTVTKFLILMAIFYDSERQTRSGDTFCAVALGLLNGKRDGLAVSEKCGGTKKVHCNDCAMPSP